MVRIATGVPQQRPRSLDPMVGMQLRAFCSCAKLLGRGAPASFGRTPSACQLLPVFETLMECSDKRLPLRTSMAAEQRDERA